MKYSHIIWDFNGTLLDDVDVAIETANIMLAKRNMKTLSGRDEYYSVFRFPVIEYYNLLGYDFQKESYDDVAREWVEIYIEITKNAALRSGIPALLEKLYAQTNMIILSATEKTMLDLQVGRLGIKGYFSQIIGTEDIYGHGKTQAALAWKESVHPGRMLMIGDTEHDLECAKKLGADCVLLSGGHQSAKALSSLEVPVANSLEELLQIIEEI